MPTEPAQLTLAVFELCLLLSGAVLVLWLLFHPGARARWLGTNALPPTPATLSDFLLCAGLIFCVSFICQAVAQLAFGLKIADAVDHQGLTLFVYSVANYTGALLAWRVLFPSLRRSWMSEHDVVPLPPVQTTTLPWSRALRYALGVLMLALPLLSIISLGWTYLLEHLGLPVVPQDVVAIFANTRSPFVITGMLLVACVFAPIYEELLFRAGIFRFARDNQNGVPMLLSVPFLAVAIKIGYDAWSSFSDQALTLGLKSFFTSLGLLAIGVVIFGLARKSILIAQNRRGLSIILSGLYFGAMHTTLSGFLPLAVLGMGLAVAYEATGSIRVPIIAHGLFNLNTVLVLLSGLPELAK